MIVEFTFLFNTDSDSYQEYFILLIMAKELPRFYCGSVYIDFKALNRNAFRLLKETFIQRLVTIIICFD